MQKKRRNTDIRRNHTHRGGGAGRTGHMENCTHRGVGEGRTDHREKRTHRGGEKGRTARTETRMYRGAGNGRRYSGRNDTHRGRKRRKRFAPVFLLLLCVLLIIGGLTVYKDSVDEELPPSLEEFGEKYPEAQEFVNNYHKYKDRAFDPDLELEVTQGEIPLFIQWDSRWGYQTYGSNLLGINGCGPTSLSMVVCGLTGSTEWNPYRVAQLAEERGYYVDGVGTSWDLMTGGAEALGLHSEQGTVSAEYISEQLSVSSPMICSMYPGDFTYTGHFIVLTGLDENGDIIVNDPNSRINSEKHWSPDTLVPQIRSVWRYTL